MTWLIESYVTDTKEYLVARQSDGSWILLFKGQVTTDFPDQNAAIAYAESLNQLNTIGS